MNIVHCNDEGSFRAGIAFKQPTILIPNEQITCPDVGQ